MISILSPVCYKFVNIGYCFHINTVVDELWLSDIKREFSYYASYFIPVCFIKLIVL